MYCTACIFVCFFGVCICTCASIKCKNAILQLIFWFLEQPQIHIKVFSSPGWTWLWRRGWRGWRGFNDLRITDGKLGSSRSCSLSLSTFPSWLPKLTFKLSDHVWLSGQVWSGGGVVAGWPSRPWHAPPQVGGLPPPKVWASHLEPPPRRGLHTSGNELEVMAKITTFLVVFVAIFCGWPCLLHFMAGEQLQMYIF